MIDICIFVNTETCKDRDERVVSGFDLRLCATSVFSVVKELLDTTTTETQRTQRLHTDEGQTKTLPDGRLCLKSRTSFVIAGSSLLGSPSISMTYVQVEQSAVFHLLASQLSSSK
jgi:hypothetical protein